MKRFSNWCSVSHGHQLTEDLHGMWVLFSDHEAELDRVITGYGAVETNLERLQNKWASRDLKIEELTAEGRNNIGQWQAMRDEVLHHPEWDNDTINEILGVIDAYMPDTPSGREES